MQPREYLSSRNQDAPTRGHTITVRGVEVKGRGRDFRMLIVACVWWLESERLHWCRWHFDRVHDKTVIGWVEYVDLPEWGIDGVKAKVDTGARTSALHVEDLELLDHLRARFRVVYSRRAPFKRKWVTAKIVKRARVRSSTGEYSERYFVRARIRLGDTEKLIELSLVSREKMLFRMLIGRKALERDFLVDVSRRTAVTRRPKRKSSVGKKFK